MLHKNKAKVSISLLQLKRLRNIDNCCNETRPSTANININFVLVAIGSISLPSFSFIAYVINLIKIKGKQFEQINKTIQATPQTTAADKKKMIR
ncbi:MAG TPA: hypothetical protein VIR31_01530 [Nitrososphaeraceae archaeon]